jgi:hypothetical protein
MQGRGVHRAAAVSAAGLGGMGVKCRSCTCIMAVTKRRRTGVQVAAGGAGEWVQEVKQRQQQQQASAAGLGGMGVWCRAWHNAQINWRSGSCTGGRGGGERLHGNSSRRQQQAWGAWMG